MPFYLWEFDRVRRIASPRTAVARDTTWCLCNRFVLRNKPVKELRISTVFARYETQDFCLQEVGRTGGADARVGILRNAVLRV
jgi:hypothetical protein